MSFGVVVFGSSLERVQPDSGTRPEIVSHRAQASRGTRLKSCSRRSDSGFGFRFEGALGRNIIIGLRDITRQGKAGDEEERNVSERERNEVYLQDVQDGKRAPPVVRATPIRRGITSIFRLPAAAVGAPSNKKQL